MISEVQIIEMFNNTEGGLTVLQEANYNHSVSWKKNSKRLFDELSNSLEDFRDAVAWCGTNGNVSRTIETHAFNGYCEWLFKILSAIKDGSFELKNTPAFGGKVPLSWVSKICHIINPNRYPVIYDSFTRKAFHVSALHSFQKVLDVLRNCANNLEEEQIYHKDSFIWAKNKN